MSLTGERFTELDRVQFFIDGAWADPVGDGVNHQTEAATGEIIGTAALGGAPDIDAAVRAARRGVRRRAVGTVDCAGTGRDAAPPRRRTRNQGSRHRPARQPRERYADRVL
ncbi:MULTISPECIES: hypothetical protein [Prauserella salsuginis group]|uniref:Aldehyde dehydrogenase family protein n=1 Tax=Prauserella salsuginis TaxID=387889 RepID=A0ABW6G0Y4_9PSEU|nr:MULTISPECIES: hypothetical protein [Prauserella salsuginis group]